MTMQDIGMYLSDERQLGANRRQREEALMQDTEKMRAFPLLFKQFQMNRSEQLRPVIQSIIDAMRGG